MSVAFQSSQKRSTKPGSNFVSLVPESVLQKTFKRRQHRRAQSCAKVKKQQRLTEEQITKQKETNIDLMVNNWPFVKMKPKLIAGRHNSGNWYLDTLTNVTLPESSPSHTNKTISKALKSKFQRNKPDQT